MHRWPAPYADAQAPSFGADHAVLATQILPSLQSRPCGSCPGCTLVDAQMVGPVAAWQALSLSVAHGPQRVRVAELPGRQSARAAVAVTHAPPIQSLPAPQLASVVHGPQVLTMQICR
jgi:hypothetical protein